MNERLSAIRACMKAHGIDVYVVPTDDFHLSEYVGKYFECRHYLTGFTGSAGVAVVTETEAKLWTDGRYFLQAEEQLKDTGFDLMKMGVEGVPRLTEYISEALTEGSVLGYDGRVISAGLGTLLDGIVAEKGATIEASYDLVGEIWADRPALSHEKAWILSEEYAGESAASKLKRVREKMAENECDTHIVTSLDDIMWILNIRGNDVSHSPVVLSYLKLTKDTCTLYVQEEALTDEVRAYFESLGVETKAYNDVYEDARALAQEGGHTVLLSLDAVNDRLYRELKQGAKIVNLPNPSQMMKAIKNPTEVANIEKAHLKDGVAMTKWLYWFKHTLGKETLTECGVAKKLDDFRRAVDTSVDISFDTIAGYGPNGAIVHYEPEEGKDATILEKSFLLVDSGGHYLEGTTDITRTIACGPLTEQEKEYFTLVLKGHLSLASARFLEGCTGVSLDYLAREPLWKRGLDYRHGTGHGIGYLLNVHEGPNGFRYRIVPERKDSGEFKEGMVTSDEPGIYIENAFGVRIESVIICKKGEKNEFGQFYYFDNVTLCPIDLNAVKVELLTESERAYLNDYHRSVYEKLSPFMTEEERAWLKEETREI